MGLSRWSYSAHILARHRAADAEWLGALRQILERWGHDARDADVRTRTIYLVHIGHTSIQT